MRAEFVGREAELTALSECVASGLEGHPRVAICSGEPGIGKTRLAQELAELAEIRGIAAVWGLAVDSAGAPPFWPWRQVLRALGERVDVNAIAERLGIRADLAALAPEVFSECQQSAGSVRSVEDRFRLFDAVGRLLRTVTADEALVIVLDDVHWARWIARCASAA